jgi:Mg2+ and Co2+ transporter CorA
VRREKLVFKLTLLGFIYILVLFTASIFGMNFAQLGSGSLSIVAWVVLVIPVYLVSALVLYADLPAMIKTLAGWQTKLPRP